MKHFLTAAAFVLAPPAFAEEPAKRTVRSTLHQALDEKAALPARPPSLPDAALEQARERRATLPGKKGDAVRAAHELAGKSAEAHAHRVQADGNAERNASHAAKGASEDRNTATALIRSNNAKSHDERGDDGKDGDGRDIRRP